MSYLSGHGLALVTDLPEGVAGVFDVLFGEEWTETPEFLDQARLEQLELAFDA